MKREIAIELIVSSRETKDTYNMPLFIWKDVDKLLQHFEILDFHITTCNSLQKSSSYIEKSRCLIYDTGVTEYFAFLNNYIDSEVNDRIFEGIVLRLFAESFFIVGEFGFCEYLQRGYGHYEDSLLARLNSDSYKYLPTQELFVIAHELAHDKFRSSDFKLSDAYEREKEALICFRDVAKNRIKVPQKWIEYFNEKLEDSNFTEEFICDSLAIRALFSIFKINLDSIYDMSSAIISAVFTQYIIAAINSDANFAQVFMTLVRRNKNNLDNFKREYPASLFDFGMYVVYRYGYVRFCINTICQDFGISYEDMKSIDNHTFNVGEKFSKLLILKNDASQEIMPLFYDYRESECLGKSTIDVNTKEVRRLTKDIFIAQAHKYNEWLQGMRNKPVSPALPYSV